MPIWEHGGQVAGRSDTGFWMSRVDRGAPTSLWAPGRGSRRRKRPCSTPLEFCDIYELPFANERTCFSKGKTCLSVTFSRVCGKRSKKLPQKPGLLSECI